MRVAMLVLHDMRVDPRVHRSAMFLAGLGHDVSVFALRSSDLPEQEQSAGYQICRVADSTTASTRQLVSKLRQQRARTAELQESVESFRPDVVHCHDANTLEAGGHAATAARSALVFDAHELYAESLRVHRSQRSWPVQRYWRAVERRWARRADSVITVSDGAAEILSARCGCDVTVVANVPELGPIGDRSLLRRELGIAEDQVVVLYQAAILPGRATTELVEAVARIPRAALVVQGAGPVEPEMRARVDRLGVAERTWFMGMVPPEQLLDYTSGADIGTCFADGVTLNQEIAWANRLFMYFMAGIPSAVTDLRGIAGLVRSYDAGTVARRRDVDDMVRALQELAEEADLRRRMGHNARVAAETRFNWAAESAKLEAIYRGIETKRKR